MIEIVNYVTAAGGSGQIPQFEAARQAVGVKTYSAAVLALSRADGSRGEKTVPLLDDRAGLSIHQIIRVSRITRILQLSMNVVGQLVAFYLGDEIFGV